MSRETSLSVSYATREDVRQLSAVLGGILRRRVTMPDAIRIACQIASEANPDTVIAAADAVDNTNH